MSDFWGPRDHPRLDLNDEGVPPIRRRSAWIFALIVVLVTATASFAWGTYVQQRIQPHGQQWPAGKAWTDDDGVTFQPVKVTEVTSYLTYSGDDYQAPVGSAFQQWQVKVSDLSKGPEGRPNCTFQLLGTNDAVWQPENASPKDVVSSCYDDEIVGDDVVITITFLVPQSRADEVLGIQQERGMSLNQPPVLPRP